MNRGNLHLHILLYENENLGVDFFSNYLISFSVFFIYMGAVLKQEACRVQSSAFNNVTWITFYSLHGVFYVQHHIAKHHLSDCSCCVKLSKPIDLASYDHDKRNNSKRKLFFIS